MIKRSVLVISIVLLLSIVGFGAYRAAQSFATFVSAPAETITPGTLQSSTVPQVDGTSTIPPAHRPVVVTYVDRNGGQTRMQSRNEEEQRTDERYYIAVSYVKEDVAPATDTKRLIVTAALGSRTGPPVRVEPQALTLVDDAGQRHTPIDEETGDASDLVGATVTNDESVYGFVSFDIPAAVAPVALEWCPDATDSCARIVQAPIP